MKFLKKFNEATKYLKFAETQELITEYCEEFTRLGVIKGTWRINAEGLVDVDGSLDVRNLRYPNSQRLMSRLPFKFGYVTCDLHLIGTHLQTLEGCPQSIGGSLIISHTPITNLTHCPKRVGRDFILRNDEIESLEGGPQHVGGKIILQTKKLESFQFFPLEVGGDVEISAPLVETLSGLPENLDGDFIFQGINDSPNRGLLRNLHGSPQYIRGRFDVSLHQITSLEGGPVHVYDDYLCRHNKLTNLIGSPQETFGDFIVGDNPITSLEGAPKKVEGSFDVRSTEIETLEFAPIVSKTFSAPFCGKLYCPMGIRDSECGLWLDGTPLIRLLDLFGGASGYLRGQKKFRDSLDYNYITKKDGVWCLIRWKLIEALQELEVEYDDRDIENLFINYKLI